MQKRILTGDNATGKLHLGHYVGSLENRVKLQNDYETFIIIADMHALAYPKYVSDPKVVADAVLQVAMDNLAVGLDPNKSCIFPESAIPEIYELATIFSMLIPFTRNARNPTVKNEIRDKGLGDNYSMGFLNFPLLQVADILCVKADAVPVGEDQLPHIELANEVVRKFNATYGKVFEETKAIVGRVRRLVGVDGKPKMTKSLDNCIYLSDSKEELERKVSKMYTDPKRLHATDPGTVEGNPVFIYHDAFNKNKAEVEELKERYRNGKVGDVEVKQKLFEALDSFLEPIRKKRAYYETHQKEVNEILLQGIHKAGNEAKKTLEQARDAMKLFKL